MTRALPADLVPIADSRGPSVANPGLRVLRWIDWSSGFQLHDSDETSYLKSAANLFKKQAKPDSVVSHTLALVHLRDRDRQQALQQQGWHVRTLKAACAGRLRLSTAVPSPGDQGIALAGEREQAPELPVRQAAGEV